MNGLPYYKAYPRDFIEGTIGMPFEVKCAYRVVLDLIYMQGGNLPDNARYISGLLGCSIRKWNTIRNALVATGKLSVNGEFLTNYRAVSELESLRKVQEKKRENRSTPNKNKDLPKRPSHHAEPDTDTEIEAYASISRARKRASRLPETWVLPRDWGEWAVREGWPESVIRLEAEKFRDYWISVNGQKAAKLDWFATWRNWLRNVPKKEKANGRMEAAGSSVNRAQRIAARLASRVDRGPDRDTSGALFLPRLVTGGSGGGTD